MPSNLGVSAFPPSLLLSEPVSVPGMGSLILIDGVIHSADTLNDAGDSKKEQAFTTEGSSVVEEKETNLKFGDELLTINMGALLAEVRNDSVNFPSIRDELQEKAEKEVEEIQEMVEQEMVEQEVVEEVEEKAAEEVKEEMSVELDAEESHLPVTEFFILDPRDKTSFDNVQNPSPFFLLNRRNIEKKQKVRKVEKEEVMEGGKSLKTRVVYINNQRLELPPESR